MPRPEPEAEAELCQAEIWPVEASPTRPGECSGGEGPTLDSSATATFASVRSLC